MNKKFLVTTFLFFFVFNIFSTSLVYALDPDTEKKIKDGGKKVKDLIEKYEKASTTKYNEIDVSVKDTDGNPRDCTFRLYYNDYKQEKFETNGGTANKMFDHGKTTPSKLLSVAVQDCPCKIIKMDQTGPIYPAIYEEIEKIKIVLEGEVEGAITGKITEEGKKIVEKGLTKFFEGMGYAGGAMAKRFMSAVSVGAEMGAPFRDFINKEIDKIFDAVREEARKSHELTGDDTPVRNNVNIIKPRWEIRNIFGLTKPKPFTQYNLDILLQCPRNANPPQHIYWKPTKWIKPITPPVTPPSKPPVTTGEGEESDKDYSESVKEWNERIERENKEREEEAARQAEENAKYEAERKAEQEQKAKEEAEAKAKAEAVAKECKKCDKIKQAIDTKRNEYNEAWDDINDQSDRLSEMRKKTDKLKRDKAKADAKRDNFNEPGSDYVESDGRRIDATDLELRDAAADQGWERYQAGELSAQELSDYWKGLDADTVDALREKVKQQLEEAAKKADEALDKHEKEIKDQEAKKDEATKKANDLRTELDTLEAAYKDCLKKCQKDKSNINIEKDYGIKLQPSVSPVSKIWPWNWGEEVTYTVVLNDIQIDESTKEKEPSFHSVLNEIGNTSLFDVSQHSVGTDKTLVQVTTPTGDGGIGAALQILFADETPKEEEKEIVFIEFNLADEDPEEKNSEATRSFVLAFSEPMDKDTVEDTFELREFPQKDLTVHADSENTEGSNEDGFGNNIWDDSHFDIDWNSDDTEVTFTFKNERELLMDNTYEGSGFENLDEALQVGNLINEPKDSLFLADKDWKKIEEPLDDYTPDNPEDLGDGEILADGTVVPNRPKDPIGTTGEDLFNEPIGGPPGGNDIIDGPPSGNDELSGELGNDRLFGGPGNDIIGEEPEEDSVPKETPIVCPDGEYRSTNQVETDICSHQCGGNDSHCVATTPGCGRCVSNCPVGEYSGQTTCNASCSKEDQCIPSGNESFYGKSCWICIAVPEKFKSTCAKKGMFEDSNCANTCNSDSRCSKNEDGCFSCKYQPKEVPPPEPTCPSPSFERSECTSCENGCESFSYIGDNELACYTCKEPEDSICVPSCSEKVCGSDGCGGSCGSCSDGETCNAFGSCEGPIIEETCEDKCAQHGFSSTEIDFTADVEAQLNSVTCVSAYSMQLQTATVGECQCYPTTAPTITFDRTVPICTGTPCGDVSCGESASCPGGENQILTVSCNWGGWKKQQQYQYSPIVGGN